jgi:hypothetical protein
VDQSLTAAGLISTEENYSLLLKPAKYILYDLIFCENLFVFEIFGLNRRYQAHEPILFETQDRGLTGELFSSPRKQEM